MGSAGLVMRTNGAAAIGCVATSARVPTGEACGRLPGGFALSEIKRHLILGWALGFCLLAATGCQTVQEFACNVHSGTVGCEAPAPAALAQEGVPTTATIQEPTDVQYYPSDNPLRLGLEHFGRGNYGMAERYFRDAVEKAPRDVTAWVGLAASYDRLRGFDLADQAYAQALKLRGPTVQILNNQGYSYMLRGDFVRARQKFMHAYKLDPGSATIQNNLQLLSSSQRFVTRPPE